METTSWCLGSARGLVGCAVGLQASPFPLESFCPEPTVLENSALRQGDWPFRHKHVVDLPFGDKGD